MATAVAMVKMATNDPIETRSQLLPGVELDRSRCVLCGGPNACVMASDRDPGDDTPCWCVGKTFPAALTSEASAIDGGAACICATCLAERETDGRR